jgi:hypothetical protein
MQIREEYFTCIKAGMTIEEATKNVSWKVYKGGIVAIRIAGITMKATKCGLAAATASG